MIAPANDDDDRNFDQGAEHRDRMAKRSRERMSAVSDIGDIPPVVNPARREACRLDLKRFLVEYFPHSTGLTPFSADHDRVIARNQLACLETARVCNVVYRGFAKTTISENTAIWAAVYGHRKFIPVFGSDATRAARIIDSIKMELETNDLLYEDFPEVCHAIRALEGKPQRQHSQHHNGKRTFIEWTADVVVLPSIEGSVASGAILTSHGLMAAGRGMKYKTAKGENRRPDLPILDDFQTDESAASPLQVEKRLGIIKRSILRMGGHRTAMSCICNGTIIAPDDGVDQLSTPALNPSWQSERIPMIRQWAKRHEDWWLTEYANARNTYDPDDAGDQMRARGEATALYVAHREIADEGCIVSWESCYDPDSEVSAIQHAYNILIDDGPAVFASECQNAPLKNTPADMIEMRPVDIAARVNGLKRGEVPLSATHLVGHIDVQHSLLYWSVFGCDDAMTGSIVDRNTFPEQHSQFFALREAKRRLANAYPGTNAQAAVEQGLMDLIAHLFSRDWKREDGLSQPLELLLIDWSDGTMDEVVARVCRTSPHKANLMPMAGVGIGPGDTPMAQFKIRPGEKLGRHWLENRNSAKAIRSIRADVNYWKSRAAEALTCPPTNPGAIKLYGGEREDHRMYADHCCSESRERMTHERTKVTADVWKKKPNRENHYWDTLVGCLVAASVRGCGTKDRTERKVSKIPAHMLNKRF